MLDKVPPSKASTGENLYVNVYDLNPINGYIYWFGLGIYHSAIEAHGVEYAFGAHDYPTSGIFEVEPRSCPGFTFRKSILVGTIDLGPKEFREFIEEMACKYNGDSYHLITRNCNHFCEEVCQRLTGFSIPGWVNRLARLACICKCLVPDGVQVNAVHDTPEYQPYEGKAKDARSTYNRLAGTLAAVAPRKRRLSVSSTFLQFSYKGGVTSWDRKISNSMKERLRHI